MARRRPLVESFMHADPSPRKNGLAWEKSLDEQREHQLIREGLFWHDEQLDGLSDDDRLGGQAGQRVMVSDAGLCCGC